MTFGFHSLTELLAILTAEGLSAPEYLLKREAFLSGEDPATVSAELDRRIEVTRQALVRGLERPQVSRSGLTTGAAAVYARSGRSLVDGPLFRRAVAYSLAINEVNACGGRVVAFPTAGSSGIVPGVLWAYVQVRLRQTPETPGLVLAPAPLSPDECGRMREGFLVAGLVGILVAQGATLAGSEGGCQAECGAAGAMAACALCHLEGLPLESCFSAAALSLKNSLGLTCDPVAGLVEVPCVKRNAFVAANALTAADLALAGVSSVIPFDEVVWAMKQIGDVLPLSLKETALGGLAKTPTALQRGGQGWSSNIGES